jgi:glycosyltransferase involved in cell wall biosynthesis
MSQKVQKIAIVHDFLLTMGGAERVLLEMAEMYPSAPVYTLLADEALVKKYFPERIVRTSFLQNFPSWLKRHHRFLLPFYPVAVESLNLRDFDTVLSSSGAWSKGLVTRLYTKHVAYIHSPMRYAWDSHEEYLGVLKKKRNFLLRGILSYLRVWDFEAAQRPEILIANSKYTQARIAKYYRRGALCIYPSPSLAHRHPTESFQKKSYFLVVSRLTKIKHIDVVIDAFNKLGFPLVVVGEGSEKKSLAKMAEQHISFTGFVPDEELAKLYGEARALIFPSEEDFGLAAAESLSFGTPVIAFEHGGIREIVTPGVTGEFFVSKTREVISEAVLRFTQNEENYSQAAMQEKSKEFSREHFTREIKKAVEENYDYHSRT